MRSELEEHLFNRVREGRKPREVIDSMLSVGSIKNAKQAHRTLEKWARKGLYEFGVCLDLGWLTEKATGPLCHCKRAGVLALFGLPYCSEHYPPFRAAREHAQRKGEP